MLNLYRVQAVRIMMQLDSQSHIFVELVWRYEQAAGTGHVELSQ